MICRRLVRIGETMVSSPILNEPHADAKTRKRHKRKTRIVSGGARFLGRPARLPGRPVSRPYLLLRHLRTGQKDALQRPIHRHARYRLPPIPTRTARHLPLPDPRNVRRLPHPNLSRANQTDLPPQTITPLADALARL